MPPSTRRSSSTPTTHDPTRCGVLVQSSWYPCLNPKGTCRVHKSIPSHILPFTQYMVAKDAQKFFYEMAPWFITYDKKVQLMDMFDKVLLARINELQTSVTIKVPEIGFTPLFITLAEMYMQGMVMEAFDFFGIMSRIAVSRWHPQCIAGLFDTRDHLFAQIKEVTMVSNDQVLFVFA